MSQLLLARITNLPGQLPVWEELEYQYLKKTHDFWQCVDLYTYHMRAGYEKFLPIINLKCERQVV